MVKEKLEDLSIEKLRKRKKIYFVLMCVMSGMAIFGIIFTLVVIFSEEKTLILIFGGLWNIVVPGLFSLGFNKGLKKFNGEIRRRENK